MGQVRQQSARKILRTDPQRPEAFTGRNRLVEPARRSRGYGYCRGARERVKSYLRSLAARFFRRAETERELEDELRSHIQLRVKELERAGLSRASAMRRAQIEFGSAERF